MFAVQYTVMPETIASAAPSTRAASGTSSAMSVIHPVEQRTSPINISIAAGM